MGPKANRKLIRFRLDTRVRWRRCCCSSAEGHWKRGFSHQSPLGTWKWAPKIPSHQSSPAVLLPYHSTTIPHEEQYIVEAALWITHQHRLFSSTEVHPLRWEKLPSWSWSCRLQVEGAGGLFIRPLHSANQAGTFKPVMRNHDAAVSLVDQGKGANLWQRLGSRYGRRRYKIY